MLRYRTLDQRIKFQGKLIPPYTEVEVADEDMPVWNELVRKKVAEGPQVALELPEDDESAPTEKAAEKPKSRRRKSES